MWRSVLILWWAAKSINVWKTLQKLNEQLTTPVESPHTPKLSKRTHLF